MWRSFCLCHQYEIFILYGCAALLASNGFFNRSILEELNLFNVETVGNRVAGESN
jgi:hypothetical protein